MANRRLSSKSGFLSRAGVCVAFGTTVACGGETGGEVVGPPLTPAGQTPVGNGGSTSGTPSVGSNDGANPVPSVPAANGGAPASSGQGGSSPATPPSTTPPATGSAGAPPVVDTSCTMGAPQACGGTLPPEDAVLIDFATYQATGAWGDMTVGDLTGGTSPYGTPATTAVENGGLRIQATLPPLGFSGLVFWFGPCLNASAFGGVGLTIGGSLGGAALKFQVQTHLDYPVEPENSKGACVFSSCATKWSECVGPTATVVVPATPTVTTLPWGAFAGGSPIDGVSSEGLVGLQFQIECQASVECVVDMTLAAISLSPL